MFKYIIGLWTIEVLKARGWNSLEVNSILLMDLNFFI
jgi:hypothetical protein